MSLRTAVRDIDVTSTPERVAIAGSVLTALAALLPWISFGIASIPGIEANGLFTLLFGVGAGAVLHYRCWGRTERQIVAILGALIVLTALGTVATMGIYGGPYGLGPQPGYGLYLTVLGGLLCAAPPALELAVGR